MTIRIGVIGDLHTFWDDVDVAQFDRSAYDLLYFTGDLGGGTPDSSLRIARTISRLRKRALVMPGNNDTGDIAELAAELAHRGGLRRLNEVREGARDTSGDRISLCGYSTHRLTQGAVDVTLIAGRPHGMGGPDLSFPEHMAAAYGIDSLEASRQRLLSLVDQAQTRNVVFLSHNGPTGLGAAPEDMWGCDFKPGGGDWGDPDLAAAIDHAQRCDKRVLAVVAGHMHLRTKDGQQRPWCVEREGIVYVNAARVPRIFSGAGDVQRHHVALSIGASEVQVREQLVDESDNQ
jgi:uncharacterized protein (TIGR04168 family)